MADITMLTTDEVTTMIAADSDQDISNAKWSVTLTDITTWGTIFSSGKRQTKRVGPIEWYRGSETSELDFRNRLRNRYGYDPLVSIQGGLEVSSLVWF